MHHTYLPERTPHWLMQLSTHTTYQPDSSTRNQSSSLIDTLSTYPSPDHIPQSQVPLDPPSSSAPTYPHSEPINTLTWLALNAINAPYSLN